MALRSFTYNGNAKCELCAGMAIKNMDSGAELSLSQGKHLEPNSEYFNARGINRREQCCILNNFTSMRA